jgi:hypothetical protein
MPQRIDDPTIENDDWLWRRIRNRPEWYAQNPDGSYRLSSVAFLDTYTNEVSVDQAKLTMREKALRLDQDDGLAQIKAGLPRSLQHIVSADPEPDNPAHALICPPNTLTSGQRKSSARTMAKAAEWLVLPKSLRNA